MKTHMRIFTFFLAFLMLFTIAGCETLSSTPTTGSTPVDSESLSQDLAAAIVKLEDALAAATENYDDALEILEQDFAIKLEGLDPNSAQAKAFAAQKAALSFTLEERTALLSIMMNALEKLDGKDAATVASLIAEAEAMVSESNHSYGKIIAHSNNKDTTPCTEAKYYQICDKCNAIKWSNGQHQHYYHRTPTGHQRVCKLCQQKDEASGHATLENGKCSDCSYVVNANILIIESIAGESTLFQQSIDSGHSVTVVQAQDSTNMPQSAEALQQYHEVILCNIANRDLPKGFDKILESYVQDFGGGLFTIGGNTADSTDEEWTPNAYTKEDMYGTRYQDMLPVEIYDYTPAKAVMILVDVSGSMFNLGSEIYEASRLYYAIQGVEACLDVMSERDYIGIITIGDEPGTVLELTPRTQRDKIIDAIDSITDYSGGGTILSIPLERAGRALDAMTNVENKHIIIITDGEPADQDFERYTWAMTENAKKGITTSIMGLQCTRMATRNLKNVLIQYAGMKESNFYTVDDLPTINQAMHKDLCAPELSDVSYATYLPAIDETFAQNWGISQEEIPTLDGFYAGKLKRGATQILSWSYGPMYAQWQYGKGMVGSFMCDLSGKWSAEFLADETGKDILNSILLELANPPEDDEDTTDPA